MRASSHSSGFKLTSKETSVYEHVSPHRSNTEAFHRHKPTARTNVGLRQGIVISWQLKAID